MVVRQYYCVYDVNEAEDGSTPRGGGDSIRYTKNGQRRDEHQDRPGWHELREGRRDVAGEKV